MNFIIGGKIISSNKSYNNQKKNSSSFRSNSINIIEDKNSKTSISIPPEQSNYNVDQWTPYNPSKSFGISRSILTKQYPKCPEPPSSGSPDISEYAPFVFDESSKIWTRVV
jgi:hypothetical protein